MLQQVYAGERANKIGCLNYSFSQRANNKWNKLSTDCVHASSANNMLKNRIDKYIVRPIRILRTVCYSDMWHLNETHEG